MTSSKKVDIGDFDAVGVLSDLFVTLREKVMLSEVEASAIFSAPDGWHVVVVTAKPGGSTVLICRFHQLSLSRLRNVADALVRRGWLLDEDREGATLRMAPGTTTTDVAFEVLAALVTAGAPSGEREIELRDGQGNPIALS